MKSHLHFYRFCHCSPILIIPATALRLCYALRLEHRRCALWLGMLH
ncbi:MAG: hypothetical protein K2N70_01710 [Helicobacter sp.]|nr:hypothetical protein [Helicobacter sp.]